MSPGHPGATRRAVRILSVDANTVRPMRRAVLRPYEAEEAVHYATDAVAEHLAAYEADGHLVGVATVFAEEHPETGEPGWRLRGMGVAADARGTGCGGWLLAAVVDHVARSGGHLLWCNARVSALGFYQRYGFTVESDVFFVVGGGEHRRMRRVV